MYALDFEYDGQCLSDYNFIVCSFDDSSGLTTTTAGSQINFTTVSRNKGRRYGLVSTQYDECIQATFDICKNPCLYNQEDMAITNDEYRDIMRWLNRKQFLKFQIVDEEDRDPCFYDASFNIQKIKIGEVLYGLELTMETNRPFGYGAEQITNWTFSSAGSRTLMDYSDEIGTISPNITITCTSAGDLTIKNETLNSTMVVYNCVADEVITIDGENLIISTSKLSHNICNDFNYEFLKIGNTYSERRNVISVSLPCKLEIRYTPIIKDSP